MSLALQTGIPFSAWAAETDETLETAFELMAERSKD